MGKMRNAPSCSNFLIEFAAAAAQVEPAEEPASLMGKPEKCCRAMNHRHHDWFLRRGSAQHSGLDLPRIFHC